MSRLRPDATVTYPHPQPRLSLGEYRADLASRGH